MSESDEEDDRIEALIEAARWCDQCCCQIGYGDCDGCIAVESALDAESTAETE